MPYITVDRTGNAPVSLYYEDHGRGRPVVLVHGSPLDARCWEKQAAALLAAGYRVIAYDRRGFGRSDKPAHGYEHGSFAADLDVIMETLDLRDAILAGFSAGTGDVGRYLTVYGAGRVAKAAFLAPIQPGPLRSPHNPNGLRRPVFNLILDAARADRYAFSDDFFAAFYNTDRFLGTPRLSEAALRASRNFAARASAHATAACVHTWAADLRPDVERIAALGLPTLILHGAADRILPAHATARPFRDAVPHAAYVEIEDAPHGLLWTHADEVNEALLAFVKG